MPANHSKIAVPHVLPNRTACNSPMSATNAGRVSYQDWVKRRIRGKTVFDQGGWSTGSTIWSAISNHAEKRRIGFWNREKRKKRRRSGTGIWISVAFGFWASFDMFVYLSCDSKRLQKWFQVNNSIDKQENRFQVLSPIVFGFLFFADQAINTQQAWQRILFRS